jgi:hypothetical protein
MISPILTSLPFRLSLALAAILGDAPAGAGCAVVLAVVATGAAGATVAAGFGAVVAAVVAAGAAGADVAVEAGADVHPLAITTSAVASESPGPKILFT